MAGPSALAGIPTCLGLGRVSPVPTLGASPGTSNLQPPDPSDYNLGVSIARPSSLRRMLHTLLPTDRPVGDAAVLDAGWRLDGAGAYCPRCGASSAAEALTATGCAHCRGRRIAWARTYRLGAYDQPLSDWIKAMKFGRLWPWCGWLGRRLGEQVRADPTLVARSAEAALIVTWVPLHWSRRVGRGFDQSRLIAEALADGIDAPCGRLLRRVRRTPPQARIAAHDKRQANVRNAFAGRRGVDLSGFRVLLVDDVKTTGATATRCVRLLRGMGAAEVRLAVAAVADPKAYGFQAT